MAAVVRQSVLIVKDGLSSDQRDVVSYTKNMVREAKEDLYTKQLVLRVRAARNARVPALTQDQIALLLGIEQTTYSKYESLKRQSRIPHELLWKFCQICNVSWEWLIEGLGKGPTIEPMSVFQNVRVRKKRANKAKAA